MNHFNLKKKKKLKQCWIESLPTKGKIKRQREKFLLKDVYLPERNRISGVEKKKMSGYFWRIHQ